MKVLTISATEHIKYIFSLFFMIMVIFFSLSLSPTMNLLYDATHYTYVCLKKGVCFRDAMRKYFRNHQLDL